VAKRFISGIHAISLMGASCIATVVGCPPDKSGHILACLSQPPEKTVVPSSFQAEHKTFNNKQKFGLKVHPMALQFQNILYKIVEIQMHYWLIMRN
jgi:hypothetical protein